ncbi:MAG: 2-oxoacid:acceptor oxidoreductase subunit alpha [Candidatus Kerfeldbacteria bacterium]|nr:2-oxoacid:acceptor oxidoreductase subunit alpha [Candidatus Kerfeldbacteria bacterium]
MNTHNNEPQHPLDGFQFKVGGEAGFGVMIIGQMFSKLCVRSGRWTFDYPEYPSLISGGHTTYQVVVGLKPVRAPIRPVHLLVALNQETIDLHTAELAPGAGIVFDPNQPGLHVDGLKEQGIHLFPIPLEKLSHEAGNEKTRNVVALAVCAGLLNASRDVLNQLIRDAFAAKGDEVVTMNLKAAELGFADAEREFSASFPWQLNAVKAPQRMTVTGNTAVALGAIRGGCGLYAAYPMTPATTILTYLAKVGEQFGMVVRHAEDEIAAINAAIGASYAGVRSMVGTSGGGFALMVEGVGLAAELEVPIVIVEGQRPGPSTGLPTWTGQADLQFILRSSQGEFPRIVLAPGDVQECFVLTFQALNLAEKYQLPVFILTDKFIGESAATTEPFFFDHLRFHRGEIDLHPEPDANGMYPRYHVTASGVSPRTLPGTPGGVHIANSDEHDVYGFADETADNRIQMMDKRMRKLASALADVLPPARYGPNAADLTLVTWGSTKGPALDALDLLAAQGHKVNLLHFAYLFPLPVDKLEATFRSCKNVMVIEGNATGQFARLLKEEVGLLPEATFFKYDGRPFLPEEIAGEAEHFLNRR